MEDTRDIDYMTFVILVLVRAALLYRMNFFFAHSIVK